MRIEGAVRIGEGAQWFARVNRRVWGGHGPALLSAGAAAAVLIAVLVAAYAWLTARGLAPDQGWYWLTLIAITSGAIVGHLVSHRVQLWRWRRRVALRGVADPFGLAVELQPEGFVYSSRGVEKRFSWDVVSEVLREGAYWVVIAETDSLFVPRRWFPDAQVERQFISALLARLHPAARARSKDAVAFTGS